MSVVTLPPTATLIQVVAVDGRYQISNLLSLVALSVHCTWSVVAVRLTSRRLLGAAGVVDAGVGDGVGVGVADGDGDGVGDGVGVADGDGAGVGGGVGDVLAAGVEAADPLVAYNGPFQPEQPASLQACT